MSAPMSVAVILENGCEASLDRRALTLAVSGEGTKAIDTGKMTLNEVAAMIRCEVLVDEVAHSSVTYRLKKMVSK